MPNPFVHVELYVEDVAKAKEFYRHLFKWKLRDLPIDPETAYAVVDVGEGTGGAIMQKPSPEMPSFWLPYVQVDDARGTLARARAAGAEILIDLTEIPAAGWFGVLVDPFGAVLGVYELPARERARRPRKPAKKTAARKPAQKTAARKPAQKPAARKPAQKPATRRPAQKPAARRPAQKPATRRPAQKTAARPPARRAKSPRRR